jgi:hypothetical protein
MWVALMVWLIFAWAVVAAECPEFGALECAVGLDWLRPELQPWIAALVAFSVFAVWSDYN